MTRVLHGEPDYRFLLSCFATGVTVATTVDDNGLPIGMTASAVSAVSITPPLLLVCVSKVARFHDALTGNTGFALNILAEHQGDVSELFARGLDNPFLHVPHTEGPGGLCLLDDVVAHIICGSWSTYDAGDHTVFFGEVRRGQVFERAPLVHYRSRYTTTI